MKSDRCTRLMLLVLVMLGIALGVQAADADVMEGRPAAEPRSPMMREIFAALETKQIAVAELQARFAAEGDATRALDLQREAETLKMAAELEILRIQLRYARDEGRDEAAARLEAAIDTMTAPRPRLEPREESRSRDPLVDPEVRGR